MTKVTITADKWDSLSKEERQLAKKLGICVLNPLTVRERKEPKISIRSTYILDIYTTCLLCDAVTNTVFKMSIGTSNGKPFLQSTLLDEINPTDTNPIRKEFRFARNCCCCFSRLSTWTKSRLVVTAIKLSSKHSITTRVL